MGSGSPFIAVTAAADDLEAVAARLFEGRERFDEPAARHSVAQWMCQHRLAAGGMYPADAFFQACPDSCHVTGLAAGQEALEGLRRGVGVLAVAEPLGEMRARHVAVDREQLRARISTLDTVDAQAPTDLCRADSARSLQVRQT